MIYSLTEILFYIILFGSISIYIYKRYKSLKPQNDTILEIKLTKKDWEKYIESNIIFLIIITFISLIIYQFIHSDIKNLIVFLVICFLHLIYYNCVFVNKNKVEFYENHILINDFFLLRSFFRFRKIYFVKMAIYYKDISKYVIRGSQIDVFTKDLLHFTFNTFPYLLFGSIPNLNQKEIYRIKNIFKTKGVKEE